MTTLDLRPLSLGELLDRTFFLYRRHFFLFTGIAAIPYSLFFIVNLGSTLLTRFRLSASGVPGSGQLPPAGPALTAGSGILALVVVFAGFIAFLFSVGASVGGLILLIIPGVYLACRICVATAAVLLEDIGPSEAIRRSFVLTKGFAGRAFMIYLLYVFLAWGVITVFQVPFVLLVAVYAKQPQFVTIFLVLTQAGSFLGSVLVTPVSTIGFALFYYDLRVRKEAFDLQLMMQAIGGAPAPPPVAGNVPSMFGRDAS